jgi:ABC-type amino acid transport substrate-binding protein
VPQDIVIQLDSVDSVILNLKKDALQAAALDGITVSFFVALIFIKEQKMLEEIKEVYPQNYYFVVANCSLYIISMKIGILQW